MTIFSTGPMEAQNHIRAQQPVIDTTVSDSIKGAASIGGSIFDAWGARQQDKLGEAEVAAEKETAKFVGRALDIQAMADQGNWADSRVRLEMNKLSKEAVSALGADGFKYFTSQTSNVSSGFASLNKQALAQKQSEEADTYMTERGYKAPGEPMSGKLMDEYQDLRSEQHNIDTTIKSLDLGAKKDEREKRIDRKELKKRLEVFSMAHKRMSSNSIGRAVESYAESGDGEAALARLNAMEASQIANLGKYGDLAESDTTYLKTQFQNAKDLVSGKVSQEYYSTQLGMNKSKVEFDVFSNLNPSQQARYLVSDWLGMSVGLTADIIEAAADMTADIAKGKTVDISNSEGMGAKLKDTQKLRLNRVKSLLTSDQIKALKAQEQGLVDSANKMDTELGETTLLLEDMANPEYMESAQELTPESKAKFIDKINTKFVATAEEAINKQFDVLVNSHPALSSTMGALVSASGGAPESRGVLAIATPKVTGEGKVVWTLKEGIKLDNLTRRSFNEWASKSGQVMGNIVRATAHLNGSRDYNSVFNASFGGAF